MAQAAESQDIFTPSGDITAGSRDLLRNELLSLMEAGLVNLTLDLAKVRVVDSTGVGLIVATCNSLKERGGSLIIKNSSPDIAKMFRIMRLDKHVQLL